MHFKTFENKTMNYDERYVTYFMEVAKLTAAMSRANRLKVGAVAVRDKKILAAAWNGTPSGWDNTCEDENDNTKLEVIHAEENVVCQLAASSQSSIGADIFLTHAPCKHCAAKLAQVGFQNVYYRDVYRDMQGVELLKSHGVNVIRT